MKVDIPSLKVDNTNYKFYIPSYDMNYPDIQPYSINNKIYFIFRYYDVKKEQSYDYLVELEWNPKNLNIELNVKEI